MIIKDATTQSLPWTGERYLPQVEGGVQLEHFHRYLFAKQITQGKRVLDIASGEGYGSAMLSRSAAHVIGVDISAEAVKYAQIKYKASNLEFKVGSCAAIPIPNSSIDVVVSFETIEHHDEHEEMMLEIKRVLKPNGVLVISCPDKLEYSDKPGYKNEYHVKELYRNEFVSLLKNYYKKHIIFGQRAAYGSLILQEDEVFLSETYQLDDQNMLATPGLSNSVYLIAIAADSDIPTVKVSLLNQDLMSIAEIKERQEWISRLNQTIESLIVDRNSQKQGCDQLQFSITQLEKKRDQEVSQLQNSIQKLENEREIDTVQHTEAVSEIRSSFAKQVRSYEDEMLKLQSSFAKQVRAHEDDVFELRNAFAKQVKEHEQKTTELTEVVSLRDQQIGRSATELESVYKSKSWRLTSPLRWLVRTLTPSTVASTARGFITQPRSDRSQIVGANTETQSGTNDETNQPQFRILLVSHYCPSRGHAGGLRILDIYALIRSQCPSVQLDLLTFRRPTIDWSIDDVNQLFDNVYLSPTTDLTPQVLEQLRGSPLRYEVVDLQFHQTGHQIDSYKTIGAKIVFTPMESLAKVAFINIKSNLLTTKSAKLLKVAASLRSAAEEVVFALKADEVVCVSQADASFLRAITSSRHVRGIDTGVSQFEFAQALSTEFRPTPPFKRRCNVLYVAYFGSDTNVQALKWYLDKVHTLVREKVPDYVLTVVGRGDLSAFKQHQDSSIELVGEVDAIAPYIQEARVCIAPALGGSGFRGKVNQYSILGVPSVVSPIAHKGLVYQDHVNIFVAEDPEAFADRCIRLLTDLHLNECIGKAAREVCLTNYTWQSKWPALRKTYNLEAVSA